MTRVRPQLSPNAQYILEQRYLLRDEQGRIIETPEQMFRRVAGELAKAEEQYGAAPEQVKETAEQFYEVMARLDFLPNSPALMNAGTSRPQLAACFVREVPDSIEGIFKELQAAALIFQSGGGVGFDFSALRPEGDPVVTSGGQASGPVSFMNVFNASADAIKQGGRRRAAMMGVLRVDHPDILKFIRAKQYGGRLENFNISVAVTDAFMEAVKADREYELRHPRTGEVVGRLSAREVFDAMCECAWARGDPGILFIDRINESNPIPSQTIRATNPCAEVPLGHGEACVLGHVNLGHFVKENDHPTIEWARLEEVVRVGVRMLDNMHDRSVYPVPDIKGAALANRRIGLGVMGWADMLIELGIPYDTEQAVSLGEKVMKFINETAIHESRRLARERGPFPNWLESIYAQRGEPPRRNATVTTVAPTGTTAMIAGASSGIEPLFAVAETRTTPLGTFVTIHPLFEKIARQRGFYSEQLMLKVINHGRIQDLEEIPEDVRRLFVTTLDIAPEWHLRMQAAFQRHTENSISKTVNLPPEATVDDVRRIFMMAYDLKLKGVTVYRYGTHEHQVLHLGLAERLAEW